MKIYLAGPMTGLPEFNYPAFHAVARHLRGLGHEVENPAENPEPPCKSWEGYMRLAVAQLARCDTVALLPGWLASRGARLEHRLAVALGLRVMNVEELATFGALGIEGVTARRGGCFLTEREERDDGGRG